MPVSPTDISLTFSGGGTNIYPDLSLGGEPSVQPILGNRLFDDIAETETLDGMIDYRCFYLNNDSSVYTFYDCQLSIFYTSAGEVTVELGFDFTNERQNITIINGSSVTGGSFTIQYTDYDGVHELVISHDSSLAVWSNNLQTALRTIINLDEVVVSASASGSDFIFEIDFLGKAGNRFHETIALKSGGNNLISSLSTSIAIVKTVNGGPINRIADEIDADTTIPHDIVFSSSEVSLGDLRPLDSVPIWLKRTVPANAQAVENDGFTFKLKGSAVQ